jgi:Zn-dependent metalloprotease
VENITQEQQNLLDQLQALDAAVDVQWDKVRGVASSIRGTIGPGIDAAIDAEDRTGTFLQAYGPLVGPADLPEGLELLRRKTDDLGWEHLVYAYQVGDKVELYGAKLAAHYDADGALVEVQSSLWRDVQVDAEPEIGPDQLGEILLKRIEAIQGIDRVRGAGALDAEVDFPMTDVPRLVVYPWQGEFHLAWVTYGYGDLDEREGEPVDAPYIAYGQMFVDAKTGERILFAPTLQTAETATTGSGLAVTPLTPPHSTRALNVVRVDTTSTYRLKDTTHNRDIFTFDAACSASYDANFEISSALKNGTLPLSEDTDGNHNWNRLPTSTSAAQRTSGQQPEVDAHHMVRQQYEWYDALSGGRDGWDDGNYPNPPVPPQTISVLAHCRWPGGSCQDNNAYCWSYKSGGTWIFWLAFMDGDATTWDYLVGSRFVVAHEYQHAITHFSFEDGAHNPGLTYSGWFGAVHEGLSDVFGGLSSEDWLPARDISHATPPQVFRNLVYPRDAAAYASNKLDHFDDRNTTSGYYARGTILAHCAYLMAKGGVHVRSSRTPQYIPVYSLGRQTVGGKNVPKAARIWYRALSHYFSTHGSLTGIPANDESAFRTLRNGCVSAAVDLYGSGSLEHRNTILAFYAVGLHPTDTTYGADVTFLRWGVSWDLSRDYVGLTSPDYASLDLFVNNGGSSEWNALINVIDPSTGLPTQYENNVYCRVRNVGDADATNVQVEFHYAKAGTATWTWLPVEDKNGNAQTLNIGTLAAGQSTFSDSAQNSPPASAGIKWYIPPLASGETVDHYCIRARVTSSNDVNTHNNEVQSNIAYTPYTPPSPFTMTLVAGNPFREREIRHRLSLRARLPEGWKTHLEKYVEGDLLQPGEERPFEFVIEVPPGADEALEPPLDGDVRGTMHGDFEGEYSGSLTGTILDGNGLAGQFAALLPETGIISGPFKGALDWETAEINGRVVCPHPHKAGEHAVVEVEGCLRPWRRVDISQWADDELIGGVTVQVQVPWSKGPCAHKLPPTETKVVIADKRGNVVVAREDLMHRYSLAGDLLAEWRVEGRAYSFAIGPDDNVYVAVAGTPRVFKYDPDGQLLTEWPVEGELGSLSVVPSGKVSVVIDEGRAVLVFSPEGDLLDRWETELG